MSKESSLKKGWIENFDKKEIYCCLRKEGELDHELFYGINLLTQEQKDLICLGLLVEYDMKNETLKVSKLTEDNEIVWV